MSHDTIPDPEKTAVTVPGKGVLTESEWHASEDNRLVRNGYAGINGGRRRPSRRRKHRTLTRDRRRHRRSRAPGVVRALPRRLRHE